jgi:hypothetical protein
VLLQVGSYSAFFVRLLMVVSAPIAWPIGKLLDRLLGDEQTVSDDNLCLSGFLLDNFWSCDALKHAMCLSGYPSSPLQCLYSSVVTDRL